MPLGDFSPPCVPQGEREMCVLGFGAGVGGGFPLGWMGGCASIARCKVVGRDTPRWRGNGIREEGVGG